MLNVCIHRTYESNDSVVRPEFHTALYDCQLVYPEPLSLIILMWFFHLKLEQNRQKKKKKKALTYQKANTESIGIIRITINTKLLLTSNYHSIDYCHVMLLFCLFCLLCIQYHYNNYMAFPVALKHKQNNNKNSTGNYYILFPLEW